MSDSKVDLEWEALKASFVESLRDRKKELVALQQKLRQGPIEVKSGEMTELHFHAHKLSGIAESYGFSAVGDVGRQIDDAILDLKERAVPSVNSSQLTAWILQLIQSIDSVIKDH